MTLQSAQVAVSTAAVSLASGGVNGAHVRVNNPSGPTAYLGGGTAVSGTTGYALPGTTTLNLELEAHESLYAITAAGTATLHVLTGGA